jgi:predicted dehydrogenase
MDKRDGMNFAPQGVKKQQVVEKGEFIFAAVALDHGHIYGMAAALTDAGGVCKYVYDPDPDKAAAFVKQNPDVQMAGSLEKILQDHTVHMVAAAGVPNTRGPLGVKVMEHGKDYFVDKCPFTTMGQLEEARKACKETGRKYMVYYGERLHSESSIYAGQLVEAGAIGSVIQVIGLGPHRLNKPARPDWFFIKEQYGGIICDIGSHQIEQFLYFSGAKDARVLHSKVGNYNNPETPELEDFGDASLVADNGVTNYFRIDWFTPEASPAWGDGRLMILGTKGTIEVHKYYNPFTDGSGDSVYLLNDMVNTHYQVSGKVGCPFFGELILDCLNRTEKAMTQEHAFLAARLSLEAQEKAIRLTTP